VSRRAFHPEAGCFGYRAIASNGSFTQAGGIPENGGVPEPRECLPAVGRVAGLDNMRDLVERQPLDHARQAKAVVSVEMRQADAGDLARLHAREEHLSLRAFSRIEEQPLAVPPQQIAVLVAALRRRLTGSSEDDQLTVGHGSNLRVPLRLMAEAISRRTRSGLAGMTALPAGRLCAGSRVT
jgi:hypothetical protein